MDRYIGWVLGVLVLVCTLLVDPYAHHSFTAPKYSVFISSIPVVFFFWMRVKQTFKISLIPLLMVVRLSWLAYQNIGWVMHPGSVGFLIQVCLLLLVVLATGYERKHIIGSLCWALFLIGGLETIIGIWQILNYSPNPSIPMKTPFIGTIGTSNGLGLLLVLSFFSGVFLYRNEEGRKKYSYLGILVLIGIGILLSQSRGAWLSLTATSGIIFLIYLNRRYLVFNKKRKFAIIGITALVLGGGIIGLYKMDQASSLGRVMIWEITGTMFLEHPFTGIGQERYSVEYLNYQASYLAEPEHLELTSKAANIKQAHNEYLQALAEGGLVGGILFLLIWIVPAYYLLKRTLNSRVGDETGLYLLLGIHLAVLIHSLVDSPLHVFPISIIGYINLALIPLPKKSITLDKVGKVGFLVLLIILISFTGNKLIKTYPAYYQWREGVELARQKEWNSAILNYQEAINSFGKKGELEHHLGSAMVFDGQYSRGLYWLNRSKEDFNDRNIHLSESIAFMRLKDWESAEKSALVALSMFPTHLAPHLLLGEIYYEQGKIEKSKASLLKCIKEDIPIKSLETRQISEDAKDFWRKNYGRLPEF